MEHLLLKATTTVTDQGVFEAVISTVNIDREKDIVEPDGMVKALRGWNRPIPLAWHHSVKAEDIFGSVDGQSAHVINGEVAVTGQVDLDSKVGKEAWRSMKARNLGFSFGYLIVKSADRAGGGRHIQELDVFEITATRAPMNNDTRVLSTKTAVCETCGQPVGQKTSDPEPATPALSDGSTERSDTLAAPAATGIPSAQKTPDDGYWDDLRRESYRIAASVLLDD